MESREMSLGRQGKSAFGPRRWIPLAVVLVLLSCTTLTGLVASPTPAPPTAPPTARVTRTSPPTATAGAPSGPTQTPGGPGTAPTPVEASGGIVPGPVSEAERAAAEALANTDHPPADFIGLAEALGGVPGPINPVAATEPAAWQVGDQAEFWVLNNDAVEFNQVLMELMAIGEHAYLWFDVTGPRPSAAQAQRAADVFDEVYVADIEAFGSEPNPGVDGDPRIYILHTISQRMGLGVAGYLDDSSELPKAAFAQSNEHEAFVMNVDYLDPGSTDYADTLAHEFQHMIQGNFDANDEDWVVEGSAVYAEEVLGYGGGPQGFAYSFLGQPDVQLNAWTQLGSADYGKGFMFVRYVASRFGADFARDWLQRPENGLRGLEIALADAGQDATARDVVEGWVVANLIGGDPRAPDEYRYPGLNFEPVSPMPLSGALDATVSQNAADYYSLGDQGGRVTFTGSARVRPIPAAPHSGEYYWWSGRGNQSDLTLTREFDLSGVAGATLQYSVWHDIEEGWDYAYLVASTDGGETWQGLDAPGMGTYDPQEKAYTERFYTGSSGGQWVEEAVDLTPFAGQTILVRFEYITDPILTLSGLAIDDIAVPEIGYFDDAEGDTGWQAAGFNRVTAYLPQEWSLQLVTFGGGGPAVQSVELQEGTSAEFDVAAGDEVVLIVTARAPATLEPGVYSLNVD
jgi:hypothetical protein